MRLNSWDMCTRNKVQLERSLQQRPYLDTRNNRRASFQEDRHTWTDARWKARAGKLNGRHLCRHASIS